MGLNVMKDLNSKTKMMMVFTDGRNNGGRLNPLDPSTLAEDYGIRIYTVGIGTKGKVPFLKHTLFGQGLIYSAAGFRESTLREVAEQTGGQQFLTIKRNL